MGKEQLRRGRDQLVRDRLARNRVDHVWVGNLEHSVLLRRSVRPAGSSDRCLFHSVPDTPAVGLRRVGLVKRHGDRVFLDDRVLVTVHTGVDPEGEEVLVVGSEDSGADDVAVGRGLAGQDGGGAEDTSRPGLEVDTRCLVEFPSENVLVVGDGDLGRSARSHESPPTIVWMINTLDRVTLGRLVLKLVCFHPTPSSCSWIHTTPLSLTGSPLVSQWSKSR